MAPFYKNELTHKISLILSPSLYNLFVNEDKSKENVFNFI